MHIQFKTIRYRNILSVGNNFIELKLDEHNTTLISGSNGSGKSTIIEALTFALYGKSFRKINKPQLVNSINQKDLMVELEFSIASDVYLIKRGLKPAIFEIWKNGELLNKDAASRDYQLYLEQNILKMSIKSFSQIVILGSATYVPFMELPTGQRREIIEDLLDIQIFTTMNILLKEKITDNKTTISENNYKLDLIKTKLSAAKDHASELEKLKKSEANKIKQKIGELVSNIETNETKIDILSTELNEKLSLITDKTKQKQTLEKLNVLHHELTQKHQHIINELYFYKEHNNCPTCKQNISEDFKKIISEDNGLKTNELEIGLKQIIDKKQFIENRLNEISSIEDEINKKHKEINEYRIENKLIMGQLQTYKNELTIVKQEVGDLDKTAIKKLNQELKELQLVQTNLHEQRETLGIVAAMLKDGGIKTSIIKTYIPIMNKLINQYLAEFELFVDFNLDDNFNETIKSRFRDTFSFSSFSEGEKMRISLAIMFTWRAISKLRNSVSTNLLFMDEILDSAADVEGVESLIHILHKLNMKDNIFVISHRGAQFQEKFQNFIHFDKIKNFTQMTV